MVERQVVVLDVPVRLRPVTYACRGRLVARRSVKPLPCACLVRAQGHAPCPRSSADRAPSSDGGWRWFDSSRGRARRSDRSGWAPRLQSVRCGFKSRLRLDAIRCAPQGDVGCPSAAHNGGLPGSTPGPATEALSTSGKTTTASRSRWAMVLVIKAPSALARHLNRRYITTSQPQLR